MQLYLSLLAVAQAISAHLDGIVRNVHTAKVVNSVHNEGDVGVAASIATFSPSKRSPATIPLTYQMCWLHLAVPSFIAVAAAVVAVAVAVAVELEERGEV